MVFDRDDLPLFVVDHGAQIAVVQAGGCVLLEEALTLGPVRAAQERQRAADHVGRHPVPHHAVVVGEILLGDADIDPVDAVRMGEAHIAALPGLCGALGGHGFRRPLAARCGGLPGRCGRRPGRSRPCGRCVSCGFLADHRGHLPCDFLGRLVLAHALEGRLAHEAVGGPAAEVRLDHHLRLDPAHVAAAFLRGQALERRPRDLERMKALPQVLRHGVRIAGADAARIDEPSILVIADHERADRLRHGGRRRIAADHEFLGVGALGLDEALRAAGAIGRIRALRHDAFQAHLAGLLEHERAVIVEMLAVADRAGGILGSLQQALQARPCAR